MAGLRAVGPASRGEIRGPGRVDAAMATFAVKTNFLSEVNLQLRGG
ncbi:hypothetical protein HMPREF3227_01531 [Corynebacterium sp. CMW7794]|nr:hypothetical protein HMPREF0307_00295 [Corynebacterium sp. DNF00584]KXI17505.1 hypothetical protein HMPREF3227_01531 [Corynebacterium sp. CMW7794]